MSYTELCHNLTVSSFEADAIKFPLGENVTSFTVPYSSIINNLLF